MYKILVIAFIGLSLMQAITANEVTKKEVPEKKWVFAHYMTCFFDTVEGYEYEIALAQRNGIEGFAMNCGEWLKKDKKTGEWVEGSYIKATERMYQAAKNLDSGFKIFISADMTGIRADSPSVPDMVKRFYNHPNQLRYNGVPVFSTYTGRAKNFVEPLSTLEQEGYPTSFVPHFGAFHRYSARYSSEQIMKLFLKNKHLDGWFNFAVDDSINGIISSNANAAKAAVMMDKIYMAGNSPSFNSPNLRDFQLGRGYGAIWEGIIRDGAPWVELTTWNDYQEDSYLAPRMYPEYSKDIFGHDESYLQLTEYYSKWFKNGVAPVIEQDKLYYSYRNRKTTQVKAFDFTKDRRNPKWADITRDTKKVDQIHDDAQNKVYVTMFLTDDAALEITIGDMKKIFSVKKGVSTVDVPLIPGVPQFKLIRKNSELLNISGRRSIIEKEDKQNSFQTQHHKQNRTWIGGAAHGKAIILKASSASLLPNTTLEDGVAQTTETNGSGLNFPLSDIKAGTYNIRVRYKNSGAYDARLSMEATGSPMPIRQGANNSYHMSLFLPPTGNDFKTVSLIWSLFDKTDQLSVLYRLEKEVKWRSAEHTRLRGDRGAVKIDQIELVYIPELKEVQAESNFVLIPAGSFTMGSNDGEVDETPAHNVSVSSFAMSKYELTNAEYEKFDLTHRQYRDGLSWRDDEPVIYTAWRDIAKYCNWLSEKHGLEKVYDKKTYAIDMSANGFRMPTEAEWEYVATGRDEDREYPWGNEKPQPGVHGNFAGRNTLDVITANLRSSFDQGAMLVGTYPKGSSRDGIMDLAGNVGEWCLDTYLPYLAQAQTNPLETGKSHSHVIRGGTWTYYNHSQRSRDREFNSQGYPGFSYVGARLVVSEEGYKKIGYK